MEESRSIPWTLPIKPLTEGRVALIRWAGIALKSDKPFEPEGERRNPWWDDPSYRILPNTASACDVRLYHLHVELRPAE